MPELICTGGMLLLTCVAILSALMFVASVVKRRDRVAECPTCGGTIPELSAYCMHCGASVAGDGE